MCGEYVECVGVWNGRIGVSLENIGVCGECGEVNGGDKRDAGVKPTGEWVIVTINPNCTCE